MDAQELLERYAHGERNFRDANLEAAHFEGAVLDGAMLDCANLQGAHLEGASLCRTNLERANLGCANLEGSNLAGANLNRARLDGANLRAVILVEADLGRAYLVDANLKWANLRGATMHRAILRRAQLQEAHLDDARLEEATLIECRLDRACLDRAYLDHAQLRGARLDQARLQDAILYGADMRGSELREASLERACLMGVNFTGSQMPGAQFSQASLGATLLIDVDLEPLCATELLHFGPSTVDYASVLRSVNCKNLKQFLNDTGMPQVFADDMISSARALSPIERTSCTFSTYIAYIGPDEAFARRLHASLREDGVGSFFFGFDFEVGELNANSMCLRVREHDRVIMVCSAAALARPDIRNELNALRQRERKLGQSPRVVPVIVDDFALSEEFKSLDPALSAYLAGCMVADFRVPREPTAQYSGAILALEDALRLSTPTWPPTQANPVAPESRVTLRG